MALDVDLIRKDFPILERKVGDGRALVYLDSAASSQKPRQVLEDEGYEKYTGVAAEDEIRAGA